MFNESPGHMVHITHPPQKIIVVLIENVVSSVSRLKKKRNINVPKANMVCWIWMVQALQKKNIWYQARLAFCIFGVYIQRNRVSTAAFFIISRGGINKNNDSQVRGRAQPQTVLAMTCFHDIVVVEVKQQRRFLMKSWCPGWVSCGIHVVSNSNS